VNKAITSELPRILSSTLGILDPFIHINIDSPASYKADGHSSRYFCRLQLEHKAAAVTYVNPHIARAINI